MGRVGPYSHENVLKPKSAFYFWLNPITKRASWAGAELGSGL